jgi:hypothetical protein
MEAVMTKANAATVVVVVFEAVYAVSGAVVAVGTEAEMHAAARSQNAEIDALFGAPSVDTLDGDLVIVRQAR